MGIVQKSCVSQHLLKMDGSTRFTQDLLPDALHRASSGLYPARSHAATIMVAMLIKMGTTAFAAAILNKNR